jgi:hypothetical protein
MIAINVVVLLACLGLVGGNIYRPYDINSVRYPTIAGSMYLNLFMSCTFHLFLCYVYLYYYFLLGEMKLVMDDVNFNLYMILTDFHEIHVSHSLIPLCLPSSLFLLSSIPIPFFIQKGSSDWGKHH